jgi:hypothetical protein
MEEMGFPFGRELTAIEAEVRAATFRSILEMDRDKSQQGKNNPERGLWPKNSTSHRTAFLIWK